MKKGALYLLPNHLGSDHLAAVIPDDVRTLAIKTRYFAVENIRTARRYLRKLDSNFPIDDTTFFLLNKKTPLNELPRMLVPLSKGQDVAILSEAGCPGIADPGSDLVALAHQKKEHIIPLTGPSSIFLGLMASGFNGQSFCFHGYIPIDKSKRINKINQWEQAVRKNGQTQIFMDTPYRNNRLLEDLLKECSQDTLLCIACDITLPTENIQTKTIKEWRKKQYDLNKRPTMFLLGKTF